MKSFYVLANPPEGGLFRVRENKDGGKSPKDGETVMTEAELKQAIADAEGGLPPKEPTLLERIADMDARIAVLESKVP